VKQIYEQKTARRLRAAGCLCKEIQNMCQRSRPLYRTGQATNYFTQGFQELQGVFVNVSQGNLEATLLELLLGASLALKGLVSWSQVTLLELLLGASLN